jgi:biotin transport system substrate-specific component
MNSTIATRITPISNDMLRNIILAIAGSLVLAAAANVSIPMWPVPMTLQTLAVLAIGGAYGSRLGMATILLYIVEGMVGLPFFAGGNHGLFNANGTIFATIGFWAGFVIAAGVVGRLAQSGWINSYARMIGAALLGAVVLYIPGLLWLGVWAAKTQGMDAMAATQAAFNWGLIPFIPGDIIKAIVAGLGLSATWNGVKNLSQSKTK